MEKSQKKSRIGSAIAFLSSLTITVSVISGLIIAVGLNLWLTDALRHSRIEYGGMLAACARSLGLVDLSQSWLLAGLLGLFFLNLLLCTVRRIPSTLRAIRSGSCSGQAAAPEHQLCREASDIPLAADATAGRAAQILRQLIAAPALCDDETLAIKSPPLEKGDQGGGYLFAQKGRFAHLGFYLSHAGLLLILAGALLSTRGYQGFIHLREGQAAGMVFYTKNQRQHCARLDFSVMLEKLQVSPAAEAKKAPCSSTVSVARNGKALKSAVIEGYETITQGFVRIGQSSFYKTADRLVTLSIALRAQPSHTALYTVTDCDIIELPATGHIVRVASIISPAPEEEKDWGAGRIKQAALDIYGPDGSFLYTANLFPGYNPGQQADPKSLPQWRRDFDITIVGVQQASPLRYTMLKAGYEPGGFLIWWGIYAAVAGFAVMLLFSHKKAWVCIEPGQAGSRAVIAVWNSRSREKAQEMAGEIKKRLEEQEKGTEGNSAEG